MFYFKQYYNFKTFVGDLYNEHSHISLNAFYIIIILRTYIRCVLANIKPMINPLN